MAKELDFEELDKAVSSLMGSIAKPNAPQNEAAPTPAPSSQAALTSADTPRIEQSAVSSTQVEKPMAASTSVRPVTNLATAPAVPARRRSGRFMDVVHPSGDMKPRSSTPPSSREGLAITPRPSVAPLGTEPTPPTPEKISTPSVAPETSPVHGIMPDPISLAEARQSGSFADATPKSVEEKPAPVTLENRPELTESTANESPFLTNAKVEKRPLGNEPPTGKDTSKSPSVDSLTAESDSDYAPALPAELNNDLVAIESKELTTHTSEQAPKVETKEDTEPRGPTSIMQQYKEQPSSGDADHAAIYDTADMPQPLAHPAKKKAGWLWIIWVVLLLVVGAGGAVLLYVTGIIP